MRFRGASDLIISACNQEESDAARGPVRLSRMNGIAVHQA